MKPIVIGSRTINPVVGLAQSLAVWLNALAVVQRPSRIVHVGIGDGRGESCVWVDWPLTKALAIDAEPIAVDFLSSNPHAQEVIAVQSHLIGETEARIAYFVASNPSENGLIDPNLLRMIWPSLTLSHQVQRDSVTLDHAAAEILDPALDSCVDPLWLIVDALPAVSILSGGVKLLDASSLVCVRALSEAGFRGEPAGADLAAIDRFMGDKCFTRVIYLPGLNPKIGHALYARKQRIDLINPVESETSLQLAQAKESLQALTSSLQQSSENLHAVQAKSEETLLERDAVQARSAALESQLQEQMQAKEQALHQLTELKQSAQSLTTSLQQSSENLQAMQAKLDIMLQERDAAQATTATLESQLQEQMQAKEQTLHQLAEAKQSEQSLIASLQQTSENLQAMQAKLDITLQERHAAQARSAALESQLQEQMQAKEQALHQLTEVKQSAQSLTASLQQSSENLHAVQAKLEATLQERDAVQARSATLESQLQEQMQAKEQALFRLADIQQSYDSLTDTLKTKETALESELLKVQRLTAENTELTHRQKLMNEELVKAEGQISLIKDLLLREQGL